MLIILRVSTQVVVTVFIFVEALEMYEAALARTPGHTLIQNNIRKVQAAMAEA